MSIFINGCAYKLIEMLFICTKKTINFNTGFQQRHLKLSKNNNFTSNLGISSEIYLKK